jgi:DNA repair photolyase
MKEEKNNYGTFEWSDKTINCINGCKNDCLYCYAKCMAIRFKRNTPDSWKNEEVRKDTLTKPVPHYKGTVMFPSTHDITVEHLTESMTMLDNILKSGNKLLVVSKPNMECIQRICETFTDYKDKILFRFTIGSTDSKVLKFWEPNAASFEERLECLALAYRMGYQTSVSGEPLLDRNVDDLISKLSPYVTDSIWIGKPNLLLSRTRMNGHSDPETIARCNELSSWISDPDFLQDLYNKYNDDPMIQWKSSIRQDIVKLLE